MAHNFQQRYKSHSESGTPQAQVSSIPSWMQCLLVALQLECGGVAGSVGHALGLVDEQAVSLDGDLLLQTHAVVLEILEGVLSAVQLLHQCIHRASNLLHLINQAGSTMVGKLGWNFVTGSQNYYYIMAGHAIVVAKDITLLFYHGNAVILTLW